jgi:outer membrane protein assembly factor BamA
MHPIPRILAGFFLLLLAAWILNGCNATKTLKEKESLLVSNAFKIDNNHLSADDFTGYLQQQPNKKLFGLFRSNITFYNMGSRGKETKFKKWLRTKVGAEPVILDTSLITVSVKQMKLYLNNKGYFNGFISDTVTYKKKKATVHYRITSGQPYKIKQLKYAIPDTQLARFVYMDTAKCLIRTGNHYDAYLLDNERTRITTNLMNYGFYRFTPTFIVYRIDSSLNNRGMNITLEITNPVVPSMEDFGMIVQSPHKRYFIDKIFIYPEYDHLQTDTNTYDTVVKTYENPDKNHPSITYYFMVREKFKVQPRTITQSIFVIPGSWYDLKDVNQTYSQLSNLQVFKYINLQFAESAGLNTLSKTGDELLDCRIELARASAHSFAITGDGTNSAGALGIQGNVGYQNRNIFRGAQLLKLNLSVSAQAQATSVTGEESSGLFNTIELGANASLIFPQFLLPVRPEKLSRYFKPKTTITIGYNFQSQKDYIRHITNITFGYTWLQSEKIKHILNPIEFSLVNVNTDSAFDAYLNGLQDKKLKNQYTDHVVAGLKYSFTFSSQKVGELRNFLYLRTNFETGGNLLYGINSLFKIPKSDSGYYTFAGLPFAQYVRPDLDLRYYQVMRSNHSLVYRFYGGVGVPYGNTKTLPFEKAFFAGGANDMRGWRMYSLGPGSYHNDTLSGTYNQIGDMQLELNLEYRFPIYKMFRGALFLDAGNIWLLYPSADLPGGLFKFNEFMSQVAIDAGFGIRLDFDFFIFRLDPAIPIRVPWYETNNRWYFNKMQLKDIVWNFGIGYPF